MASYKGIVRWTPAEDDCLAAMYVAGKSWAEICRAFPDRSLGSMESRMAKLRKRRCIPIREDKRPRRDVARYQSDRIVEPLLTRFGEQEAAFAAAFTAALGNRRHSDINTNGRRSNPFRALPNPAEFGGAASSLVGREPEDFELMGRLARILRRPVRALGSDDEHGRRIGGTMLSIAENSAEDKPEARLSYSVEFKKRLRWHIGEGEHAEFWTITPADAAEMMKRNTDEDYRNRPVNPATIRRYERAMQSGAWVVTGEPIIFSDDGVLLNGQHRLTACINSGCAFRTLVVFGIERDAFKFMDRGLKRTAAHVFAIEGVPNATLVAAATWWVYRITKLNGWTGQPEDRPENERLLEIYYEYAGLQDSVWVAQAIKREDEHLISPSLMVALHYVFAQKCRAAADEFMDKVISGVGIERQADPENAIRKWLLKDNMETGGRTNDTYRAAYVVLAWNARRAGKPIKLFRWRTEQNPNVGFPSIR